MPFVDTVVWFQGPEINGDLRLLSYGRGQRIQELIERQKQLDAPKLVPEHDLGSVGSLAQFENAEEGQNQSPVQVQYLPAGQNIKPQPPKTSMLSQLTGSPMSAADPSCFIVNDQRLMKSPCPAKSPDSKMITSPPVNKSPAAAPIAVPKNPGKWPSLPPIPPPSRKKTDSQATPTFSSSTHTSSRYL